MVHTRAAEDVMLDIPEGSTSHGCGQLPRNNAPPPPPPRAPVTVTEPPQK
jgi:hypothetical protein